MLTMHRSCEDKVHSLEIFKALSNERLDILN